jgi:hypothetical protein
LGTKDKIMSQPIARHSPSAPLWRQLAILVCRRPAVKQMPSGQDWADIWRVTAVIRARSEARAGEPGSNQTANRAQSIR